MMENITIMLERAARDIAAKGRGGGRVMEYTHRNQTDIESLLFSLREGVIFKIFPEGKLWEVNEKRRLYFQPMAVLKGAGYKWTKCGYKDICDQTFDGKKITKEEMAVAMMAASKYANFFFDLVEKKISRFKESEAQHHFERFILKRMQRRE